MKKILLLFGILSIVITGNLYGQVKDSVPTKRVRPKVGLVLSGGGAKGFAYIGLLKVLQEVNLHIDYIGGTSIGSIIGSLYAVGYAPDTIAKIIREQDWDALLTDKIERRYINFEDKEYAENYIISLPLKKKSVALKEALYEGQDVNLMLNHTLNVAYKTRDFNNLPIPFLCMGTDLLTGKAIELRSGYLPMAVRASMSIPGYFTPTYYQGHYLVDGGVVNNFPVINVKKAGAQFIIGGNVQQGLTKDIKKLDTFTKILDQVISFNRVAANEQAYKNTDLLINIKMNYGMMDFTKYDSIMAIGERVARQHYQQLKRLADSLNAIQFIPANKCDARPLDSIYINDIQINGLKQLKPQFVGHYFKDIIHKKISLKKLEDRINYTYGTNYFDHVFYELQGDNDSVRLILNLKEKSLGTIRASVHYDNDYSGSILVGATFRNLVRGTKLYTDAVLGPNPRLRTLFLVENGRSPGLGITTNFYEFDFDTYKNDVKTDEVSFTNFSGAVFMNATVKNIYNFRAGFQYEYFRFRMQYDTTYESDLVSSFNSYGNLFLSFRSDTYDNKLYPRRGFQSTLMAKYVMPLSNSWIKDVFGNALIVYFKYNQALPIGQKFSLRPGIFLGATVRGDKLPPIQNFFTFGGLNTSNYIENYQDFTGVKFSQQGGLYAAIFKAKLQYQFAKKHYIIARCDLGNNAMSLDDLFTSETFMIGYGVTYSYDSFIGPLELTIMSSNQWKRLQAFINIGFWF
ncbi:patatin-like phospholipase family protein [Candidatus Sulfidibacterium hydrothermale]|uniref:patatin-like phospholipase family protein n=1 Tax=Candidatus Sulfidibacterium hydrothermale TaxID=2875962 RepID=UPI001F0B4E52|nr:patatin-like phospholipase family protein [Candidatus Sulfidibacterium hydrothermale]UBM61878.1 patatin-like phospholipase family protein [Candidatus Sulfidibacterium hydrothermale]